MSQEKESINKGAFVRLLKQWLLIPSGTTGFIYNVEHSEQADIPDHALVLFEGRSHMECLPIYMLEKIEPDEKDKEKFKILIK